MRLHTFHRSLAAGVVMMSFVSMLPGAPAAAQQQPDPNPQSGMPLGPGMMGRQGMMDAWGRGQGMGMMDPTMMTDMTVIRSLLVNHTLIEREVEDIPNGVRTRTWSVDPGVARLIREHVRAMEARMADGRPIRLMDPLFYELFRHHAAIEMSVTDIEGGVDVVETSEDPQVALLIRQHAHRAVSEFVEYGPARMMQWTPLPEGYEAN